MMKFKNQMKEILKVEISSAIEEYKEDNEYENLLNSLNILNLIEIDNKENYEEIEKYIAMILIEIQELDLQIEDEDFIESYSSAYKFASAEELKEFIIYLDNKYYAE